MAPVSGGNAGKPLLRVILTGICGLLAIAFLGLLVLFFTSSGSEISRMEQSGQRLVIHAASKKVDGLMRRLALPPEETTAPADAEPGAASAASTPSEAESPVAVETVASPPEEFSGFDVGEEDATGESAGEATENGDSLNPIGSSEPAGASIGTERDELDSIPVYPRSAASLTQAPAEDLSEKSPHGILPKTGSTGSPMSYYGRPFKAPAEKRPLIAIVITGLGQQHSTTEAALALPADISLSFDPYAANTPIYVESARNLGHEAWLDWPVQPLDYPASDPGPLALLSAAPPEQNQERLHKLMGKISGFVGLVLSAQEGITQSGQVFIDAALELKKRGLALLATERPSNTATHGFLRENTVMARSASLIADAQLNEAAILTQLAAAEKLAKEKGSALVVIRAYPVSVKTISSWSALLAAKGFTLAPATALYNLKEQNG